MNGPKSDTLLYGVLLNITYVLYNMQYHSRIWQYDKASMTCHITQFVYWGGLKPAWLVSYSMVYNIFGILKRAEPSEVRLAWRGLCSMLYSITCMWNSIETKYTSCLTQSLHKQCKLNAISNIDKCYHHTPIFLSIWHSTKVLRQHLPATWTKEK